MRLSTLLLFAFQFLLPPALIGTTYLYLYPIFQGCGFPNAKPSEAACLANGQPGQAGERAPFRLLALADPQLEGDTSIHDTKWGSWSRITQHLQTHEVQNLNWEELWRDLESLLREDVPEALQSYRKRLDLWGNDLYLAHVFRSIKWWTDPTHVVVLGDLLGSQWIGDDEFWRRTERFWEVVYRGGRKVEQAIMDTQSIRGELLGSDKRWKNRIIAVAGNHDVGYAGDLDENRVERFEEAFGRVNWEVRFRLNETAKNGSKSAGLDSDLFAGSSPVLRLVVLNSMNLDEPALHDELRQESLDFLERELHPAHLHKDVGTVLLTHIPLYKEAGMCVDGPFFDYFGDHEGGGIKEQNHLSQQISDRILNGIAGPEKQHKSIILNGHDHAGCLSVHTYQNATATPPPEDSMSGGEERWRAREFSSLAFEYTSGAFSGVREVTVRSQMGEFGGNAGLLSAWWDYDTREWKFEYDDCVCGVQHIWWAVHVVDLVVIALGIGGLLALVIEDLSKPPTVTMSSAKKTN